MKATGIVRRIDDLGRVVIPREIRQRFGIREGSPLEIFVDENGIMLKKYNATENISESVRGIIADVHDNLFQSDIGRDNKQKALILLEEVAKILECEEME